MRLDLAALEGDEAKGALLLAGIRAGSLEVRTRGAYSGTGGGGLVFEGHIARLLFPEVRHKANLMTLPSR